MRTTRSVRTYREPSDTVSASRGPNYCFNGQKYIVGLDGRERRRWSTSSTGYVGRLVAFVDMKVDELLNDDMTLLEISTGNGNLNAFVLYNRKKVL
jgi:hypothetical protein